MGLAIDDGSIGSRKKRMSSSIDDDRINNDDHEGKCCKKSKTGIVFAVCNEDHDDANKLKAMRAMGPIEKGDAIFEAEFNLDYPPQVFALHEKYRSRKPKYLNRVHTGYVWNKYNRTHYDHENPPPKFVQGYKFNIFYPDLIDKSKTPTYTIEEDETSTETCIIRFHGGPPYEDIAFRIVNKDWEYSPKQGFKCIYNSGILQLYFNFKRCPCRR